MAFVRDCGAQITASTPRAVEIATVPISGGRVGRLRCPDPLTSKQVALLQHIMPQLTDAFLRERVVPVITQKSHVSLRALDWAVVNYSKKYGIVISHPREGVVDVHLAYLTALAHWRRRNFDPFRRRTRIYFSLGEDEHVTTPGQLSFLVWAVRLGVYDFVSNNVEAIERDMCETNARCRQEARAGSLGKRRRELSSAAKVRCLVTTTKTSQFA